ncbi:unnamed protein product [Soboliphyme baturini]|uniref:AXH domain-containing protein n=1 Tax=Soboliphyme baturini TaxID=241478 RepID=A0A183J875_9BILA|nr:unnamed protein product [Soboliphyme baturini]
MARILQPYSTALLEVGVERPFFVLKRGWSSYSPQQTKSVYGLSCRRLQVGDVCIYVTKGEQQRSKRSSTVSTVEADAAALKEGVTGGGDRQKQLQHSALHHTVAKQPVGDISLGFEPGTEH